MGLFMGCILILVGVAWFASFAGELLLRSWGLVQLGAGLGMVLANTAEIVPREKIKLASAFRTAAIAMLVVSAVALATLLVVAYVS